MKRVFRIALLLVPPLLWAQTQPGSISGRIVTANGEPAVGIRVSAMTTLESKGTGSDVASLVSLAPSDTEGRYRLDGIPPGRYLVMAGLLASPTYHPGVSAAEKATIVNVSAGASVTVIDMRMPPAVSGHIRRTRKSPKTQMPLVLAIDANGSVQFQTTANPDGSFRFDALRPGTYSLTVSNEIVPQPVPLSLNDRDIAGVELAVLEMVDIEGSLSVDGGGLRPRVELSLVPLQSGLCPWLATWTANTTAFYGTFEKCSMGAPVDGNGFYSASLVEGDYRASVSLPPGYFLKSMISGDVDLLANPFQAKPNASQSIRITLGIAAPPPWVKVSGRVLSQVSDSSFDFPSKVSLIPVPGAPFPLTSFNDSLVAYVSPDGSFEFPIVPAGTYMPRLDTLPVPVLPLMDTNRDLNTVEIIVIPSVKEIAGHFSIDGVTGPTTTTPQLTFELSNPAFARNFSITVATQCDGDFKAVFPEGNFSLTVTASGYTAKSVTYGGADVLQNPLKVALNDSNELLVMLTPDGVPGEAPATRSLSTPCRTPSGVKGELGLMLPVWLNPLSLPANLRADLRLHNSLPVDVVALDCVSCPTPDYPPLARVASVKDAVELAVIIGKGGAVREATVVRGHILLRDAAVEAVKTWRYKPHLVNGEPAEAQTSITVTFK